MKKIIAIIMSIALICGLCTAVSAQGPVFTGLEVNLYVEVPYGMPKAQSLVFDLRDGDTNELLSSITCEITDMSPLRLDFTVPEYEIGKRFIFHMSQGEAEIAFDGQVGAYFVLQTYAYPNEEETELFYNTSFYMGLRPAFERFANLLLDGAPRTDVPLYTFPQGVLMPAWALGSLGIESRAADDGGLILSSGERSLLLYMGQTAAYADGQAFDLELTPMYIDGDCYVPVGDTAAVFGCPVECSDDGRTLDLSIKRTPYAQTPEEKLINSRGVASDTDYLVWVSKSEYTVRVFTGSAGDWRLINSFSCAIGAPSTPTIEGTFKYYQYQDRWSYDKYYCGPIMRFRGGYAIHSTLLRYNGTDYDGRVGMRISHGCVRVRPENIKWLVDTVPLQSTIYVTA